MSYLSEYSDRDKFSLRGLSTYLTEASVSCLCSPLPLDLWYPILAQCRSSPLWACVRCTFIYKILNWKGSRVTQQYSGDPVYTNWIWHSETWTSLTRQIHIVQILSRLVLPVVLPIIFILGLGGFAFSMLSGMWLSIKWIMLLMLYQEGRYL